MKNYKPYLISFAVIVAAIILFYFIGEIVLPFIIGLLGAYFVSPIIKKIQHFIPNRNIAVSAFLVGFTALFIGIIMIFGTEIVSDFKRLNNAFETFADNNHEKIDESNEVIKSYIQKIYSIDEVQEGLNQSEAEKDSLAVNGLEDAKGALSGIMSFLGSGDGSQAEPEQNSFNWIIIFISSIAYFIYILFSFKYFEDKISHYFGSTATKNKGVQQFVNDFKRIFLEYFRKRTKVVLSCTLIFITSFLLLNLPGAIILGLIAGLLCYIAHFHYWTLIPISLSCWVLAIENDTHFLVFFGIIVALFIVISVLEEFVFTPIIMKDFNGLNPAIMIVSFAIWTHVFGSTFGILIALPLTTVMLIYLDRLLIYMKKNVLEAEE